MYYGQGIMIIIFCHWMWTWFKASSILQVVIFYNCNSLHAQYFCSFHAPHMDEFDEWIWRCKYFYTITTWKCIVQICTLLNISFKLHKENISTSSTSNCWSIHLDINMMLRYSSLYSLTIFILSIFSTEINGRLSIFTLIIKHWSILIFGPFLWLYGLTFKSQNFEWCLYHFIF